MLVPDSALIPGIKVHVEGWNPGATFVYLRTVNGVHMLETPTFGKHYSTSNRLTFHSKSRATYLRKLRKLSRPPTPDQSTGRSGRVPRPVHTKPSAAGGPEPTRSGPVSHEKTQCTAAASIEGSSSSLTGLTRHTPSTFAAPTQFRETADARGSEATPDKNGI